MTAYDDYAEALTQGEKGMGRRARAATELDTTYKTNTARLEAPDAMLNAALWYASQGIPVFPIMPGDKRPATEHGFLDAVTDADFIRAAWTINPLYNIGAPTGVLFDVVDVDGETGVNELMYGYKTWRVGLIGHALTQRPFSCHLFYKPSGKGNATAVMPGVDLRGEGGYVLMPPSIGPTGRRYRWIKPLEIPA
jgi:hypothetical protein